MVEAIQYFQGNGRIRLKQIWQSAQGGTFVVVDTLETFMDEEHPVQSFALRSGARTEQIHASGIVHAKDVNAVHSFTEIVECHVRIAIVSEEAGCSKQRGDDAPHCDLMIGHYRTALVKSLVAESHDMSLIDLPSARTGASHIQGHCSENVYESARCLT